MTARPLLAVTVQAQCDEGTLIHHVQARSIDVATADMYVYCHAEGLHLRRVRAWLTESPQHRRKGRRP